MSYPFIDWISILSIDSSRVSVITPGPSCESTQTQVYRRVLEYDRTYPCSSLSLVTFTLPYVTDKKNTEVIIILWMSPIG